MTLAVITDFSAASAVLQGKWVHRSIIVEASGVAVALTRFTVDCMNKATTVERLVIIKGRAAINTRTTKREKKCRAVPFIIVHVLITVSEWKMKTCELRTSDYFVIKTIL